MFELPTHRDENSSNNAWRDVRLVSNSVGFIGAGIVLQLYQHMQQVNSNAVRTRGLWNCRSAVNAKGVQNDASAVLIKSRQQLQITRLPVDFINK